MTQQALSDSAMLQGRAPNIKYHVSRLDTRPETVLTTPLPGGEARAFSSFIPRASPVPDVSYTLSKWLPSYSYHLIGGFEVKRWKPSTSPAQRKWLK